MTKKLRIIADENIPALNELAGDVADIVYLPGRSMQASDLHNADALLVRSVTPVNADLLHESSVRFVGTCTIGTDHVDMSYLVANNISFASAPGCNAAAVVDYVIAGIFAIYKDLSLLQQKVVGIVGCGEVGSRLQLRLQAMGIAHKVCDPFKIQATASLSEVLACDIISLHVPYTKTGDHSTHHLLDDAQLQAIIPGSLLINTSRGAVVDNVALYRMLHKKRFYSILDVYEDEPVPDMALLDALDVATAHIAGYSLQGKIRGTFQVVQAMYKVFGIDKPIPDLLSPLLRSIDVGAVEVMEIIKSAYDIRQDSCCFIEIMRKAESVKEKSAAFDRYRKDYPVRYEWSYTKVPVYGDLANVIKMLGFREN